jgi:hypothetical protein
LLGSGSCTGGGPLGVGLSLLAEASCAAGVDPVLAGGFCVEGGAGEACVWEFEVCEELWEEV